MLSRLQSRPADRANLVAKSRTQRRRERGIALFITLLLLSIVSLLGLAMMLSVNSDMMINGYYGNFRGSFYAADSGLAVLRQSLINKASTAVSMTPCLAWGSSGGTGCTTDPLNGFNGSSVITSLKSTYGGYTASSSSNSWPGSFAMADSTTCTNSFAQAAGSPVGHPSSSYPGLYDSYTYTFTYTLCSTGRAQSLQQVKVKETGSVSLTVAAQTSTSQTIQASFASFGIFIDNFSACSAPLVAGTITGPTFTNGAWNWGTSGSYVYTDPVGQSGSKASFWFGNTCKQSATSSYSSGGQTVKPTFQQGFNLGQPSVSLPSNDFSQKWAVLDGLGSGEGTGSPSNSAMNSHLKNINGTAYPTSGASSGVYLPYCTGATCSSPNTINGGGIYVEGDAAVSLSMGNDGASPANLTQTYTITQSGTTTTITTNIGANTTTVKSGVKTLTLTGVPENLTTGTPSPATLLYVDGTISGLSGPGQGQASIQDGVQMSIVANGSINVTGDLIYAHEPVTLNTSDTLVQNTYNTSGKQLTGDFNSVLGLYTANGDVILQSPYSNNNLETDASIATINSSCTSSSSSSSCGIATTNGGVNTWTIVGGRIESNAHSVTISQANTYFDRRFTSKAGFAPPWFPSTSLPAVDIQNAQAPLVTPAQPQRLSWVSYPQ